MLSPFNLQNTQLTNTPARSFQKLPRILPEPFSHAKTNKKKHTDTHTVLSLPLLLLWKAAPLIQDRITPNRPLSISCLSKQALLCLSHLFLCSLPLSPCPSPHPNSSQFRLGHNHSPLRPLQEPLCSHPHSQIPARSNLLTPCRQSSLLKARTQYNPESFCSQKTRFSIFITGSCTEPST